MDIFPFDKHIVRTEYPQNSTRVTLGSGYTFDATPDAPDARTFYLQFQGFAYFQTEAGEVDTTTEPTKNFALLDAFYQAHRLHVQFLYNHPAYGQVVVKFKEPLKTPNPIRGGMGALDGFELTLVEVPQWGSPPAVPVPRRADQRRP